VNDGQQSETAANHEGGGAQVPILFRFDWLQHASEDGDLERETEKHAFFDPTSQSNKQSRQTKNHAIKNHFNQMRRLT
jgi:hypothetical protein